MILINGNFYDIGEHMDRFYTDNGRGRPVRWNEIGYVHLGYFNPDDQTWHPVPSREQELHNLLRTVHSPANPGIKPREEKW